MRMSSWTPQILQFMEDATTQTDYFKRLASIIKRSVPKGGYVCDAGCGMGQLSFELSEHARCVDAVDISLNALSVVVNRAALGGYHNVIARFADFSELRSPVAYDCMVFCLSTSIHNALDIASHNGTGRVVVINKVHKRMEADRQMENPRPFTRERRPIVYDFEATCEEMAKRGHSFEACELTLDFGQPFRDLSQAKLFFDLYRKRSYPKGITHEELSTLLVKRNNEAFPYYLPIDRHLALFSLDVCA